MSDVKPCATDEEIKSLFVRCGSNRCRKRVLAAIGERNSYWRWSQKRNFGIYSVTQAEYEAVKEIPGVTKLKDAAGLRECVA